MNLLDWKEFKKTQLDGLNIDLLFGNGFSRRYSTLFSSDSLFAKFLTTCCSLPEKQFFELFESTNFEEIMRRLDFTIKINQKIGLSTKELESNKEQLILGFIETIKNNHPPYRDLEEGRLKSDAKILAEFHQVFTTNYDLISYHLLLEANKLFKYVYKFKDMYALVANEYTEFHRNERQDTNYFYLHGALFLFYEDYGSAYKIRAHGTYLLDRVKNEIQNGHFPMFVAGGDYKEKKFQIETTPYLDYCLYRLRGTENPLLVFGYSFDEHTELHIAEAIFHKRTKPVIVAIRDDKDSDDAIAFQLKIRKQAKSFGFDTDKLFFVKGSTVFPN